MRCSLATFCALGLIVSANACARRAEVPPIVAQTSGSAAVPGLAAPVRIVRDEWGVPHIYAQSQADLFVAQGFVQAEDRLFQMDLWKRTAQGRLSQVLGANFVERDAMTRRVQYRGDADAEWASYGSDTRAIAEAFTRGINAWVALARERPPEEFVLAGWKPEFWTAADLLSRTDAFIASTGALDDIRAGQMSDVVADQIRRVGAPPFFVGLAAPVIEPAVQAPMTAPVDERMRTVSAAAGAARATRDGIAFSEAHRLLDHPSSRYFVHLHAPGWNVIGATHPWLPGVAAGHNERVAWAGLPTNARTQEISIERDGGGDAHGGAERTIEHDTLIIKGRAAPFVFETAISPHGMVIASDRERHRGFVLRWSGTEPGAAAELASLALDRADRWDAFRAALSRWKMPARRMMYSDVEGNVGFQDTGLIPIRRGEEWVGWQTIDSLPHAFNPGGGAVGADEPSSLAPPIAAALFEHPLAITAAARRRFDFQTPRPAGDDSPVRLELHPADWDRARAINAPGQSESPASAHFTDLAAMWSAGQPLMLVFSDQAVAAHAASTLTLVPAR
jgi:penicillin amidase